MWCEDQKYDDKIKSMTRISEVWREDLKCNEKIRNVMWRAEVWGEDLKYVEKVLLQTEIIIMGVRRNIYL